ncbi:TIGR03857 family LLM class F420-dependent oxidoreductase [Mycobacterium talmoniae]|uniref:F420-dependent glucose-6-phosphate dehydrogenase n=2 Tax=Mycobacterium talmoniae TaxID=1858794 RepID=A0A2S8BFI0_9MYCO|nr:MULTISPECIES: TIGR03857 family LLM class F420-dependent oxidoreductase [Mycobacterium]PQM45396.1 F420-dependent glucose-6-phosphate dehydrogenase [Mycobacterium talmoniae]
MTINEKSTDTALAPVAEDMSAFVIAGAVTSQQEESEYDTVSRTPAQGIQDGVDAERLGFRRVWLSERIDIKWSDVILSGIAARTTRLQVCTGVIDPTTRHPWTAAAFGATMQACYGERFIMGLGRGDNGYFKGTGIQMATFRQMYDYTDILRDLWAGKHVTYDGPVGTFEDLSFAESYHGAPPPIWFGGFCGPAGARYAAAKADGVILIPMMNPTAVAEAKARIVESCERIGRDPNSIRVGALVVTAPNLSDFEARAIAHGRMVTYLQYPGYGEQLCTANGWDQGLLDKIRNHKRFANISQVADREFQRHEMMDVASVIPDEYMWDCSAIGTVDECVANLQRFIDAGADEIVTYGSTPAQNAELVAAWRNRDR